MNNTPKNLSSLLAQHQSRSKKAWWGWGLGAVALVGVGAYLMMPHDKNTVEYVTIPAARTTLHVSVTADGTLSAQRVVSIGSQLSGIVSHVNVDVNDPVHENQVLIQLDESSLKAKVTKAKATLVSSEARLQEAQSRLDNAVKKLDRLTALYKKTQGELPSQAELDDQQSLVSTTRAQVSLAKAQVHDAQATLSMAEDDLSKAQIRSPIEGVVLVRKVEPGNAVAASLQAVELLSLATDLKTLELKVNIDEADIGVVKPGQHATFTVSAYPNEAFPATFEKVAYGASQNGNVVTYTGYLTVDNSQGLLRPGMSATASIDTATVDDALVVPNSAFRYEPKKEPESKAPMVQPGPPHMQKLDKHRTETIVRGEQTRTLYVLKDGKPSQVQVVTGLNDGTYTQILSGDISAGEPIIVDQKKRK